MAAVLPVAERSPLLEGCLAALRAQRGGLVEVIVVDDSPAGTVGDIEGVETRTSGGRGPYAARNVGWRTTSADLILFLDVRSRPHPDWARRLIELFADPAVALVGSEAVVSGGSSFGARAGRRQQFFRLDNYLADPFFLPYLPTCNLGVRRSALEAVGGFTETRSGGDADLCWRVLRAGGELATVDDVLMQWIPRDRIRDYLEQNYRYGRSHYALRTMWASAGLAPEAPMPLGLIGLRAVRVLARASIAGVRGHSDGVVAQIHAGGMVAFRLGYRLAAVETATRRLRRADG